ncbi:organic cation transporter protein-like [Elysia marginata]|uniref:Organic cation transporter protein-like n=1 Tax=Elysia marginata TaxID=1093978 RepID=A0AAV4HKT4_9GAST|nr:organic cation transporter protein-like [Elysia marginata]
MELKGDQESHKEPQEVTTDKTNADDELLTTYTRGGERDSFLPVDLNQPHNLSKQNGDCPQDTAASSPADNKTFENIFHVIGHNGRFQTLMVVIFILTNANVVMQNVNTVFTLTTPKHSFGRRPSLILSCIGMLATSVGSAFVFDPISLLVARFMAGFFATFLYLSIYVLGIEFMTIQQRALLSMVTSVIFRFSDLYMALMAYLLRDWQYLLLAIAWPSVFAVALCWFMPESPRWLITKNKIGKAEREVQRIAKMNGRSVPHDITRHLRKPNEKSKHTVLQLFAERRLIVRWTILYINWIVICMTAYGLVFNISNMSGNIFLNFALGALLDAVVSVFTCFIVNRFSRKYFYFCCSAFGACACILTFIPIVLEAPSWCVVALSLVGKTAVLAAYPILYTYSAELFPTTHRGVGVGSCSMMSRIGGLLSPYIADLGFFFTGKLAYVLPQIVLGTCAMLGSLLVLFLPETRGTPLPETLDDVRGKPRRNKTSTTLDNEAA